MAANDVYPRGWQKEIAQNASGVACSITLPAANGIAHVIDHIFAKIQNYNAAAAALTCVVRLKVPSITIVEQFILSIPAGAGFNDTLDVDVNWHAPFLTAVTVDMDAGPGAGQWTELSVTGHDI